MDFFFPPELPISAYRQEIKALIEANPVTIIAGDTGSGKTTQLPKICLELFHADQRLIGCTQPRRVAATSVTARVAEELGSLSGLVGCKIRFHDQTTSATRIKFMTDGILLAETRQDPDLKKYQVVIIDEAHERNLNIDFLIGYLHRLLEKRNDLKIIITSATIDTEAFAAHFGGAPVLHIEGRTYPVEIRYLDQAGQEDDSPYLEQCIETVTDICRRYPPGDILVFLPTERDIRGCCDILSGRLPERIVLPLFGRLQLKDQQRIFGSHHLPKVVVATNVAETSITVPGIRYVVDSGLARISGYNARTRTTTLPIAKISQASCNQRSGRCGRVGPGICFRLFSEDDFLSRQEHTTPEIQRSNLAEVILQMVALKLGAPLDFPFLNPPKPASVREGYRVLQELGALAGTERLTRYGKIMAGLPIDPVISRIIIEAQKNGCLREIVIIAAALAIQDPRMRPANKEQQADEAHRSFANPRSDFMTLLNLWNGYHTQGSTFSWSALKRFCTANYLSFQRMREWFDLHEQLTRLLKDRQDFSFNSAEAAYEQMHRSLLSGLFRQCARRKQGNIYQTSGNREVMVFPGSPQYGKTGDWLIAGTFIETSRLFALIVATVEPEWIEQCAGPFCSYNWSNPRWQKKTGLVVADETVSLYGLVLITGRLVNFGKRDKKNRPEARRIFIQQGLVEGQVSGKIAFLNHNRILLETWQNTEEKLRKRDIVVDEAVVFSFYDERLPASVYDRQTLLGHLKDKPGNDAQLYLTEQDILLRPLGDRELLDYPASINYGRIVLRLSYRFEPGTDDDGVTVFLPENLVGSINGDLFDWLVPGLLIEKLTVLLKGLPKRLRKQLIPIGDAVDRIFDSLDLYRGNLYRELSASIFKYYRITVKLEEFPQQLPNHLLMHIIVIDTGGKEMTRSNSFSDLVAQFRAAPSTQRTVITRRSDERLIADLKEKVYTTWDFDAIPVRIPVRDQNDQIIGYLHAGLEPIPDQSGVTVSYFETAQKAFAINRKGTHLLYRLALKDQFKQLAKFIKLAMTGPSSVWIVGQLGSPKNSAEQMLGFVTRALCTSEIKPIIDRATFDTQVDQLKRLGVYSTGRELVDRVMALLRQRREIFEMIRRYEKRGLVDREVFAGLHQRLAELFPADLLSYATQENLGNLERYMKSLALRVERAYANPQKDRQKQHHLAHHLRNIESFRNRIDDATDEERCLYEHYCHLVDELEVSLFSPEIKTTVKVSEKIVSQAWKELSAVC